MTNYKPWDFSLVSVITEEHKVSGTYQFQPQAECYLNWAWRDTFNKTFVAFSQEHKQATDDRILNNIWSVRSFFVSGVSRSF